MRRLIRDISSVLIISGLLLVLDAGVTLVWQEPVTAVVALIKQGQIDKRFLSFKSAPCRWSTSTRSAAWPPWTSGSPSWPGESSARSRPAPRSAGS